MPPFEIILSIIAILTSFAGVISNYFLLRERVSNAEKRADHLEATQVEQTQKIRKQCSEFYRLKDRLTKLEEWQVISRDAILESKGDRSKLWHELYQKERMLLSRIDELIKAIHDLRVAMAQQKIG